MGLGLGPHFRWDLNIWRGEIKQTQNLRSTYNMNYYLSPEKYLVPLLSILVLLLLYKFLMKIWYEIVFIYTPCLFSILIFPVFFMLPSHPTPKQRNTVCCDYLRSRAVTIVNTLQSGQSLINKMWSANGWGGGGSKSLWPMASKCSKIALLGMN